MTSSKLSGRQQFRTPPAVCKIPPERGPWPPIGAPAIGLHAYANWTDMDPIAPWAQSAVFRLDRVGPANNFWGRSSDSDVRLELFVDQVDATDRWNVRIWTYDPGAEGEDFLWPSVYVDPDLPFDTLLLTDVVQPGFDFRQARVML